MRSDLLFYTCVVLIVVIGLTRRLLHARMAERDRRRRLDDLMGRRNEQ